jgi:hypothetical protein
MLNDSDTEIGGIAGSHSHIDYLCEVYRPRTRENPPEPNDYQFGQAVYVRQAVEDEEYAVVGVIYDTQLVDPDLGRSGPRLAQPEDQELFMPEYVDEKQTLAGVALLGYAAIEDAELREPAHAIPPWTLEIDAVVRKLSDEAFVRFHDRDGSIHLEYYQRILDVAGSFGADLLQGVLGQLRDQRPDEAAALSVIERNLDWDTKVGGDRG